LAQRGYQTMGHITADDTIWLVASLSLPCLCGLWLSWS
jgi:hypothetical protein